MGSRLAGLHLISVVKSREERGRNLPKLEGWACKNNKEKGFLCVLCLNSPWNFVAARSSRM